MSTEFGPYSPVRSAGDLYFVSGQVGVDPATSHAAPDIAAQTRQALKNLEAVLASTQLQLKDVVKTTVFFKNMEDFDTFNQLYSEFFPAPRPARSCVAVAELPRVAENVLLVEIEAVACRGGKAS